MFQNDLNGTLIDETMDRRLARFSIQLMHNERSDDQMLAAGVFRLDLTLMRTLFGSLTVLCVIMIQFDAFEKNVEVQ